MLSSTDVSALFANQNAQFAQANAYAQQIGMMTPPSGGTFRQPTPSFPGIAPPPPSFSFAPSSMQTYSFGNRVAGGAMSALGGAAHMGGAAIGAASMFGRMGGMAPLVDPFAGAMAGYGAAGIGGAMAGAALPLALGYGASRAIGSFVHGGQQQQAINNTLGENFHFTNASSRTGQGFDRQAMAGIGNVIRQIANVPEMMTSVEELTRMIPKMKQMGAMQGVHDIQEFNKRLKEQITSIRNISKMLGTTMDEAAEMAAHSNAVGMRGPAQQMQNAMAVQFTAAQTGMSTGQVMGMQQAGAGMATQMGIRRSVGTTAITNLAQMMQKGVETGRISQGELEDLTGQQGPEAMSAGAQMMASRLVNVAQGTSAGRLMMFGLAKFDPSGKYAGIDEDLAKGLQSGSIGREELMKRAGKLTSQQKMAASGHIGSMSMELAGKVGPSGFGQFLKGVVGAKYGENATQLLMTKLGMSENEAEITEKMAGQVGTGGEDQDLFTKLRQREAQIKETTDPSVLWQKMKTRLHAKTFGRLEQAGGEFSKKMGQAVDNYVDDLVGRQVVAMSESGAKKLEGAFSGGGKAALEGMFKSASRGVQAMGGGGSVAGALSGTSMHDVYSSVMGLMGGPQTAKQAFQESQRELGLAGMSLSGLTRGAVDRVMEQQQAKFAKMGEGLSADAKELAQKAISKNGADWSKMSQEQRFGLMKGEVTERLEGIRQREQNGDQYVTDEDRAFKAKYGKIMAAGGGGLEGDAGAITTALAAQVGVKKDVTTNALMNKVNTGNVQELMRSAEGGLVSALGDEGAAYIKAKPELAGILSKIQAGGTEGAELKHALLMGTPEEAIAAAKKAGVTLSEADVSAVKSMAMKMDASQDSGADAMKKINDYVDMNNAKDVLQLTKAAGDAGADVKDLNLKGSLAALSGKGAGAGQGDLDKVGAALADAQRRLMKAKSGSQEEKDILKSLGGFGAGAQQAKMAAEGLAKQGSTSIDELVQKFGGSKDEILADLSSKGISVVGGKVKVDKKLEEEMAALGAQHSAAGRIGMAGKSTSAGDPQAKLMDTLTSLNDTISKNSTIIAGFVTGDTKAAKAALASVQNGARPAGDAPATSSSTPAP